MDFEAFSLENVTMIWKTFNRTDLLNTRLVCRSWNKKSLRILQNSSFRLHLYNKGNEGGEDSDENCLEKFLEFARVRKIKSPQFVLPFSLHFKGSKYDETPDNLNLFITNVQLLLELFGKACVKNLEIWIFYKPELCYENVLKLLALISSGLEQLTWQGFERLQIQETPAIPIGEEILKNHTKLNFPKLSRLALTSNSCEDNSFWKFFMPKVPELKEIELEICSGIHEWTWPIFLPVNLVSKMKIKDFNQHSSSMLQKFGGKNGLCLAPVRTLELNLDITKLLVENPEEIPRTRELLKLFSSTLECLTMTIDRNYMSSKTSNCRFPFPPFPRLRYLKMTKSRHGSPIRIFLNQSNLFPALESLEIQHDLFLLKNDFDLDKFFPSAKFITLLISPKNHVFFNHENYMDKLLSQFSKLAKISLVNDFTNSFHIDFASDAGMMKCILNGLIRSNQAKRLEEIELVDCSKNYLGMSLSEMLMGLSPRLTFENLPKDPPYLKDALIGMFQRSTGIANFEITENKNENKCVTTFCPYPQQLGQGEETCFENLKRIRLSISSKGRHQLKVTPLLQGEDLYISDMSRVSPMLEQIHISTFLVSQDTQAQAKVHQEISTQFPNIRVHFD